MRKNSIVFFSLLLCIFQYSLFAGGRREAPTKNNLYGGIETAIGINTDDAYTDVSVVFGYERSIGTFFSLGGSIGLGDDVFSLFLKPRFFFNSALEKFFIGANLGLLNKNFSSSDAVYFSTGLNTGYKFVFGDNSNGFSLEPCFGYDFIPKQINIGLSIGRAYGGMAYGASERRAREEKEEQQRKEQDQAIRILDAARGYFDIYTGYGGTLLINGEENIKVSQGNTFSVTIDNVAEVINFAIRLNSGIETETIAIQINETGPNRRYDVVFLNPTLGSNAQEDFDIIQNTQGVTITRYNGSRKEVVIPGTLYGQRVTLIGSGAFRDKNLLSVIIPMTVETIEGFSRKVMGIYVDTPYYGAFSSNRRLAKIQIPDSVKTIGDWAFYNCGIRDLELGNGLQSIGNLTFAANRQLDIRLVIPDSLITIGDMAFTNCRLTGLVLGRGLQSIGEDSFKNNAITSLTISSSTTRIGKDSFSGCPLTTVTLPGNMNDNNVKIIDGNLGNYYIGQGKRAGTYVKNGPVWVLE